MDVNTAAKTIQLILAPVVMITACGILLGGMLAHYTSINDRIRALTAERLPLSLLAPSEDRVALSDERLTEIDHQVPLLLARHRQVHHAILFANSAVVVLVLSMFVIAAAALAHSSVVGTVALFMFLSGTAALMTSAAFMSVEIRNSHAAVSYEAMRVIELPAIWARDPAKPLD